MKIAHLSLLLAALLICAIMCGCSTVPSSNIASSDPSTLQDNNDDISVATKSDLDLENFKEYFKIFARHFPFAAYTQEDYENEDFYLSALYGVFEIASYAQDAKGTPFSMEKDGCINIPKDVAASVAEEMFSFTLDLTDAENHVEFKSPQENCFGISLASDYGETENKIISEPYIENQQIIICTSLMQKGYDNAPDTLVKNLVYTFSINENSLYVPYKLTSIKEK